MMLRLWYLLFVPCTLAYVSYVPEQVHISYGENPWEITVMWNTLNNTWTSVVEYGINGLALRAESKHPKKFISPGTNGSAQFIHRVTLKKLTPDSKYIYHVGSMLGWSEEFSFRTPPEDQTTWYPRLAIYGDMGNENAKSLPRLQQEVQRGKYDAILHDDGERGNVFMRQIQPIAAYVPYMTCAGNHEEKFNFTHYRNRFGMPGNTEGLFFSFNMGNVHFISISTEVYYFLQYGLKMVVKQYEWLEKDLQEATSPQNRTLRPWIVVFGHRPMYCSNNNTDDCTYMETMTRVGLPGEEMFYRYGVDLLIWAHEHSYERLWPIYDYKVLNGSYEAPYTNPKAPVHIVTGSAGCREIHDNFKGNAPAWSGFRSTHYGYTRMNVANNTHIHLEQVSVDLVYVLFAYSNLPPSFAEVSFTRKEWWWTNFGSSKKHTQPSHNYEMTNFLTNVDFLYLEKTVYNINNQQLHIKAFGT
ncbi:Uncharacterized protein GBIM_20882 [Gryllus bimaculatus]|nr:Uncharacterized protein GBIM_20882 [Gryllus bimaculatus]